MNEFLKSVKSHVMIWKKGGRTKEVTRNFLALLRKAMIAWWRPFPFSGLRDAGRTRKQFFSRTGSWLTGVRVGESISPVVAVPADQATAYQSPFFQIIIVRRLTCRQYCKAILGLAHRARASGDLKEREKCDNFSIQLYTLIVALSRYLVKPPPQQKRPFKRRFWCF